MIRVVVLSLMLASLAAAAPKVKLGIDVLKAENFAILKGRRVGVVANPASVDGTMSPTVQVLRDAPNVKLVALFGPEHGVWGDVYAGDKIENATDPRTGLPVFSLYGKTRKATPDMMNAIDVMVFDLQDIGSRSYTFISTLRYCVQACAEANKTLIVLDRPNPLGGLRIEGGLVDAKFASFVSFLPVPYVHGMTTGELARLCRDLDVPAYDKLEVVKMQGWRRDMTWDDTGLTWVATSPHVPTSASTWAYAATGIAGELSQISNGVGYTQPFEIVGMPGLDGEKLAASLNKTYAGQAIYFRPIRFKPFYATFKGEACQGVQIHLDPHTAPNLTELNYRLLAAMDAKAIFAKAEKRFEMFDKVSGTDAARNALVSGKLEPLFADWRKASEKFRVDRKPFLLYE